MPQISSGEYFYWCMPGMPEPHYNFVLTDPDSNGEVLVVNMTSMPHAKNAQFDRSCILNPGDETFVKHPSYVFYSETSSMPANGVASMIKRSKGSKRGRLKPAVFAKVLQGAYATTEMPPELQNKFFP